MDFSFNTLVLDTKKKRGSLYFSLVPYIEALASPLVVEGATQKPTPKYDITHCIKQ